MISHIPRGVKGVFKPARSLWRLGRSCSRNSPRLRTLGRGTWHIRSGGGTAGVLARGEGLKNAWFYQTFYIVPATARCFGHIWKLALFWMTTHWTQKLRLKSKRRSLRQTWWLSQFHLVSSELLKASCERVGLYLEGIIGCCGGVVLSPSEPAAEMMSRSEEDVHHLWSSFFCHDNEFEAKDRMWGSKKWRLDILHYSSSCCSRISTSRWVPPTATRG